MDSIIKPRGITDFPAFTGERVYMQEFTLVGGLPPELRRWQDTVDQMLLGISTDGPMYLMIDQSVAVAGTSQRRPGLHIDGYWDPGVQGHNTHRAVTGHGAAPSHRSMPVRHSPVPTHRQSPPSHRSAPRHMATPTHSSLSNSWAEASFAAPEGIILASSVSAARGFVGKFDGVIGDMGDCSNIDTADMQVLNMAANRVYAGNVCCLHESLPVRETCERTLVRLNVPGWSPE